MKRVLLILVIALCVIPVSAQDATPEPTAEVTETPVDLTNIFTEPGIFEVNQPFGGRDRSYLVSIPESYFPSEAPMPLVVVLHGAGGNGEGMISLTDFSPLNELANFIAVYPNGLNGFWNDGRIGDPRIDDTIDDVSFLTTLVLSMQDTLNIDASRVYFTGYSMGGFMSMRVACRAPEMVAAVASVAATMPQYILSECAGTTPIPFMLIHGTNDTVIPWLGYVTQSGTGYLSALDTAAYWANRNGCEAPSGIVDFPDIDPDDETRVLIETYQNCTNDAEVSLVGVYRGGHTWAGHPFRGLSQLGLTTNDLDATATIWTFFNAHQR